MRWMITILFFLPGLLQAQYNLALKHICSEDPDKDVHLFVDGTNIRERVVSLGGIYKYQQGKYHAVIVPCASVKELAEWSGTRRIDYQFGNPTVLNDTNRRVNNIDSIYNGDLPLLQGYSGEGVLMGIIDGGLDHNHPDFQFSDGRTRVLRYWKQHDPFDAGRTPAKYGYGQTFDSTDINAGLVTTYGQFADHGNTVTGTAAGNANANGYHRGVAPESDLIIVSSDFTVGGWRATVADAVDYIISVADSLGRPCVINASLGDYLGSHDGLDPAALYIDSLLAAQPGRIMVCAAGNSGNIGNYHLRATTTTDTSFTWFEYNAAMALVPGVFIELWGDSADLAQVEFSIASDKVTGAYERRGRTGFYSVTDLIGGLNDTIWSANGDTLAIVEYLAEQRDGQYMVQVLIPEPDSIDYHFALLHTGSGAFDLWSGAWMGLNDMTESGLPTPAQFPPIAHYQLPDNEKIIVDSWACSPLVITTANYSGYTDYLDIDGIPRTITSAVQGGISVNSSSGPTRDGRLKPEIAATGDVTFSAGTLAKLAQFATSGRDKLWPGGMHLRNGGTSMASPVIAGLAALYLEKCPSGTQTEFRDAVFNTASADGFTGATPNQSWGHGKVNGFRAMVETNFTFQIDGSDQFCQPGSTVLSPPAGLTPLEWHDGSTNNTLVVGQEDTVQLLAADQYGCLSWSDSLFVTETTPPVISVSITYAQDMGAWGAALTAPSNGMGYTWYDGSMSVIQTGTDSVFVTNNEVYTVEVDYGNGCVSSDTIAVTLLGVGIHQKHPFRVYPNPSSGLLYIDGPPLGMYIIWSMEGREVWRSNAENGTISVELARGSYAVQWITSDGTFISPIVIE